MAGSKDATEVYQRLKTVIQSDLPAKLDALDAEYDDDIVLEDIAEIRSAPVRRHETFPALVLAATNTNKPDRTRSNDIWVHRFQGLLIVIGDQGTASGGDPAGLMPTEVLVFRSSRTMRGLVEVLEAKPSLTISGTDHCDQIWIDDIDYAEIIGPSEEDMFRKDALLSFRVMVST